MSAVAGNEVARMYAGALLEIGQEKGTLPRIEEEVGFLASVLAADRDLVLYLNAPGVDKEAKKSLIDRVFSSELCDVTINFIKLTIDKDRQRLIGDIHQALTELIDIANNRQRATVITSEKLNPQMREKITETLKSKFRKEIILDEIIDQKIIGGIVIRVGDLIIDASLAKDLKSIKEKLLISKVRSEAAYED
jgi:F-type H+-transporting ATPase subunit delta